MVKSRDYWAKRQTQLMSGLDKKDDKFSVKLAREYDKILDDMQKEVAYYYQNYGVDNVLEYRNMMKNLSDSEREKAFRDFDTFVVNNPQYAHLVGTRNGIYNLNRMEALEISTRMKMAELGIIEQDEMKEYLKKSYEYGYMSTAKSLDNYSSFFNLDNQILEATLNQKWFDNKNYSDRIWGNKDILRNYLTSDLRNGIISGSSYDKMIKQLQQRIDVGKSNARRLVWTESAFMLNQANAKAFIDDGIERYKYAAIIDSRTSEICKALNEDSFEFSKYQPGLNAPPMHAYCRSTIIPIENEVKSSIEPKNNQRESSSYDIYKEFDSALEKELQAESNKWMNEITQEESNSIDNFTGTWYNDYNGLLMDPSYNSIDNEWIYENIQHLDNAIDKFSLNNDIITYRGISLKEKEAILNGDYFKEYKSTSGNAEIADNFAKNHDGITVKFNIPKGSNGAYIGNDSTVDDEKEFLIGRGTTYEVKETSEGLEVTLNGNRKEKLPTEEWDDDDDD